MFVPNLNFLSRENKCPCSACSRIYHFQCSPRRSRNIVKIYISVQKLRLIFYRPPEIKLNLHYSAVCLFFFPSYLTFPRTVQMFKRVNRHILLMHCEVRWTHTRHHVTQYKILMGFYYRMPLTSRVLVGLECRSFSQEITFIELYLEICIEKE